MSLLTVICGDALTELRKLPDQSVQCCVTSPPYWGLRDYGVAGQLGLEPTPAEYVSKMVAVFNEVRRVLKDDGTLWVNLGDSYAGSGKARGGGGSGPNSAKQKTNAGAYFDAPRMRLGCARADGIVKEGSPRNRDGVGAVDGIKPKDLVGIPWMMAFALRDSGWYLRSDIIWAKKNPMPESVTDRPTKSHEYIFLMSKCQKYFYDAEAIKERTNGNAHARKANGQNSRMIIERAIGKENSKPNPSRSNIPGVTPKSQPAGSGIKANVSFHAAVCDRNRRSVWTVATAPYKSAHFATFPPELIKPCILAGSRPGDVVLDPFSGSGTTGQVALELGRKALLIELNSSYCNLIRQRCDVTPGLPLA